MAVAAILDFHKFKILTVDPLGQYASLYQISSKSGKWLQRYGDLTFFFCKMAAICHLGFVGRLLGPPTATT